VSWIALSGVLNRIIGCPESHYRVSWIALSGVLNRIFGAANCHCPAATVVTCVSWNVCSCWKSLNMLNKHLNNSCKILLTLAGGLLLTMYRLLLARRCIIVKPTFITPCAVESLEFCPVFFSARHWNASCGCKAGTYIGSVWGKVGKGNVWCA
jgi:hypothetical protein